MEKRPEGAQPSAESRRLPTGYVALAAIALVLIAWLTVRYLNKRALIRDLSTNDMALRVESARKLLEMGKLEDSLPAQPIIRRSKTAEALGEIGTDDAIRLLGVILEDQEDAPRRWAKRALVKHGMRSLPVLMKALSSSGSTCEQAVEALEEIGPQAAGKLRFLLSDRSAYEGAAEALAAAKGVGVAALVRGCYNADGNLRAQALGNMGLQRMSVAIEPARYNLKPIDGSEKGDAIKALGLIGARVATPEITPFLQDKDNRETAVTALGQIGDPRAVEPILATMTETEKRYRNAAILALRRIGSPAFPALVRDLHSSEVLKRRAAAAALVGSNSARVTGPLAAALRDPDRRVRASAALALGWEHNAEAVSPLINALSDTAWQVVDAAVDALGAVGVSAADRLLAVLRDGSQDLTVHYQVARALAAMGGPAVPKLLHTLATGEPRVQKWTLVALGEIGDQRAIQPLEALQETAGPDLKWAIDEQLRRLHRATGT